MKSDAMAKVMFKSALPPRSQGCVTSKPPAVCTPFPIVPTPGISPNQFVNRMKMKMVAKNQNVFFTRVGTEDAFEEIIKAFHHPFPEILRALGDLFHFARGQPGEQDRPQRHDPGHQH